MNFKAMRYELTGCNRIVFDKSHHATLALGVGHISLQSGWSEQSDH